MLNKELKKGGTNTTLPPKCLFPELLPPLSTALDS